MEKPKPQNGLETNYNTMRHIYLCVWLPRKKLAAVAEELFSKPTAQFKLGF